MLAWCSLASRIEQSTNPSDFSTTEIRWRRCTIVRDRVTGVNCSPSVIWIRCSLVVQGGAVAWFEGEGDALVGERWASPSPSNQATAPPCTTSEQRIQITDGEQFTPVTRSRTIVHRRHRISVVEKSLGLVDCSIRDAREHQASIVLLWSPPSLITKI
ncbi:hypothetical protein Droror1_Dr00000022 [Drosera rotundifolia]